MLDSERIRSLLQELCDTVEADWLLVGGALVSVWLNDDRRTDDIDLVGLQGTREEQYTLYEFLLDRGLPLESVNTAVDFVVRRIPAWREHLRVLVRGARGTVHGPTPTLFLLTKIRRLSEQDLEDCRLLLERGARESWEIDRSLVGAALTGLPPSANSLVARRREVLLSLLREGA